MGDLPTHHWWDSDVHCRDGVPDDSRRQTFHRNHGTRRCIESLKRALTPAGSVALEVIRAFYAVLVVFWSSVLGGNGTGWLSTVRAPSPLVLQSLISCRLHVSFCISSPTAECLSCTYVKKK